MPTLSILPRTGGRLATKPEHAEKVERKHPVLRLRLCWSPTTKLVSSIPQSCLKSTISQSAQKGLEASVTSTSITTDIPSFTNGLLLPPNERRRSGGSSH